MVPVFAVRLPWLRNMNWPLDAYKSWRGIRLMGDNKTWRGLVAGMIFATLTLWLQQLAVEHNAWIAGVTSQVDYRVLPVLVMGPLFGFGALVGDAIESFFKRQRKIPPGHGWFPFDQTDYIIGGAIATAPFVQLSVVQYVWLIIIWLCLHIGASFIGYKLGFKERPI